MTHEAYVVEMTTPDHEEEVYIFRDKDELENFLSTIVESGASLDEEVSVFALGKRLEVEVKASVGVLDEE